jgi:hypothetical protein
MRAIALFDNHDDFTSFISEIPDSEIIYEPKDTERIQIFITGIPLSNNQEDTPEDAHAAIQKVREWEERFRQAQDQSEPIHKAQRE